MKVFLTQLGKRNKYKFLDNMQVGLPGWLFLNTGVGLTSNSLFSGRRKEKKKKQISQLKIDCYIKRLSS